MTLARARERLGGRVSMHGDAGAVVQVERGAHPTIGVVLWSDAQWCDVWLGDDLTKRTRSDSVTPAKAPRGSPMAQASAAAHTFALLEEGQNVRFAKEGLTPSGQEEGRLIEKCRWGALVALADGKILAVGFHRFSRAP
jgi:hypothetical protein